MIPFTYERATDADNAIALVNGADNAKFLAGGTNLVDHMRLGVAGPELLVDVRQLPFDTVEEKSAGGVRIGATVPNSDLAANPVIRQRYPALSKALLSGASGQLRNLATTAGNLLQRTRCVYFQDVTTPCNKREPGSGCSALEGHTRHHAILGASQSCVATHPSDMAVALTMLDATVLVRGPEGTREVPITEFYRLPGEQPERDTVLGRSDLIIGVDLPEQPIAVNSTYLKVRDRASFAFALVSVAAAIEVVDGVVSDVRIAFGGVAHKPWRALLAEEALRGGPATEEAFREAAEAELAYAEPLSDNEFKVPMARNTLLSIFRQLGEVHG